MLIKKVEINNINLKPQEECPATTVGHFFDYFSKFNMEEVLVITDEDIETDIRVINQLIALKKLTKNIQIYQIEPENSYNVTEKSVIKNKLFKISIKNFYYYPWFFWLVLKHHPSLPFQTKAKQGIYNDHSYMISEKIDTSRFTCVIYNNLISASSINYHNDVEYIYDIHELEVFRNRSKSSIQRSFYIYLNELKRLQQASHIITISRLNAQTLEYMYRLDKGSINCIYNQNFVKHSDYTVANELNEPLLIYVGSVSMSRGLEDIVKLSFSYDILIIACNYKVEAIDYLRENGNSNRMEIVKGMNYEELLLNRIQQYKYPFFLILINPTHPSYRNALPNKFFQAQALNCPIIAYQDTYLADIIKEFGCGISVSILGIDNFKINIDEDEYKRMKNSMDSKIEKAIRDYKL